jgi:hypothetical protein
MLEINHRRDRRSTELAITVGDALPVEVVARGVVEIKDPRSDGR